MSNFDLPTGMNPVCKIRRFPDPSRFVVATVGHPNGDVAAAYCADHTLGAVPVWEDSPKVYNTTVSGPYDSPAGAR